MSISKPPRSYRYRASWERPDDSPADRAFFCSTNDLEQAKRETIEEFLRHQPGPLQGVSRANLSWRDNASHAVGQMIMSNGTTDVWMVYELYCFHTPTGLVIRDRVCLSEVIKAAAERERQAS